MWLGIAALLSFALSPTTAMAWQGFAVLHGAVLVVVLCRSRRRCASAGPDGFAR